MLPELQMHGRLARPPYLYFRVIRGCCKKKWRVYLRPTPTPAGILLWPRYRGSAHALFVVQMMCIDPVPPGHFRL